MIHFKVNDKKVSIPSRWEDVTFNQYLEIINGKHDLLQLVCILSGADYEQFKESTIIGLENVIQALSFLNTPPEVEGYTPKVGPYSLPGTKDGKFDIQFESLAQFEDMRMVIKDLPFKEDKYDIIALTKAYSNFVAIYLQKIRDGKYDPDKAQAMIPEVEEMPALEVICAGSFFFLKLLSLLNGIQSPSRPTNQTPKKLKPVSKSSAKGSARTARSRKRR